MLAAAREGERRAKGINEDKNEYEESDLSKHSRELDFMVSHVLGSNVLVSGKVQKARDGDESPFYTLPPFGAEFRGFIYCVRNGRVSFDYYLVAAVSNETDAILTLDEVRQAKEANIQLDYTPQYIQAVPDEVHIDFPTMHPIQARAWLEITYPETLHEIDKRIILNDQGIDEEDAVLGLRGFNITLSDEEQKYGGPRYIEAMEKYLNGMVSLDHRVPYLLSVDGLYIGHAPSGYAERTHLKDEAILMSVNELGFYSFTETGNKIEGSIGLALKGMLYSYDSEDTPDKGEIILPLESIKSIESVRKLTTNRVIPADSED